MSDSSEPMGRLDSPLLAGLIVALMVAVAYACFIGALLHSRGGDVSRFVVAGGTGVNPSATPAGLTVTPGIGGYDGVAFYRLALDPLTRTETAFGIRLDNPSYRHQRIGYPLLVRLLSFGRTSWIPFLLVAVNYVAVIAVGVFGAMLSRQAGRHALWGVSLALYPGFLMTISRDTSEIVACAWMVAALVAMQGRRLVVGSLLFCLAILTRETTLLVPLAFVLVCVPGMVRGRRDFGALAAGAVPVAMFVLWQFALKWWWGILPVQAGLHGLAPPLSELARFMAANLPRRVHLQRLYFNEGLFLVVFVVTAMTVLVGRAKVPRQWTVAWSLALILAATLPGSVWIEDFGFLRIFADLYVLSAAIVLTGGRIQRWTVLVAASALWVYLGSHLIELG